MHEETDAREYARILSEGAEASGKLEVQRIVLRPKYRDTWEGKRFTLSNHCPVGAYAHILQRNGRRWVYTTTQGRAQIATLRRWSESRRVTTITGETREELESNLLDGPFGLKKAFVSADPDRRSRRCTLRGVPELSIAEEPSRKRVYLAGGKWDREQVLTALSMAGWETYDPFTLSRQDAVYEFVNDDLFAIANSELVFCVIDYPRYTGSAVEIGYARARGIPVVLVWAPGAGERIDMFVASCAEAVFTDVGAGLDWVLERHDARLLDDLPTVNEMIEKVNDEISRAMMGTYQS